MKKYLSLILSVVLMFSLCLPAVAVDDLDPPLYEQYGYESLDDMLTDWQISEKEYYSMVEEELLFADWKYDEATGDFDPPLWRYYGYESKREMLRDWEISEEDYESMVQDERLWAEQQNWTDEQWEAYYAEQFKSEKEAMGLVYDINVMFQDKALTFTDAVPELTNDRVMVPLRAVMENMGADVKFDDAARTAVITSGNIELSFVLGSDTFTVKNGGETSTIKLDSMPYIKEGRVFVPIRFVAESLGYDVFWSEEYRTGVYFDRRAIVDEINKDFTVLNSVLAMGSGLDLTKNYKGDVNMDFSITALDSLNGDQRFAIGLDAVVIENQTSAKLTMKFDVASLRSLLEMLAEDNGADLEAADVKVLFDVFDALSSDIDMIMDIDKGVFYMSGKLFAVLGDYTGVDMDENTWIELNISQMAGLEGVDLAAVIAEAQAMAGKLTMGDLLCMGYVGDGLYVDPVFAYTDLFDDLEEMYFIADSAFKKSGSSYKLSYDFSEYTGSEYAVSATVTMKNGVASRVKGGFDYNGDDGTIAFDLDMSPLSATITGNIHMKNVLKMDLSITSTMKETTESVPTAPPAGAKIIPFEELANIQ